MYDTVTYTGWFLAFLSFIYAVIAHGRQRRSQQAAEEFQRSSKEKLDRIHEYEEESIRHRDQIDRMKSLRARLDWSDVQEAAQDIAQWLKVSYPVVDVIVAPGPRGAIFAQRIAHYFGGDPSIIVGITRDLEDKPERLFAGSVIIENSSWSVELPSDIRELRHCKLLVVDDFARSGRFMKNFKMRLIEDENFQEENIATAVLVTMKEATDRGRVDRCWLVAREEDFVFPWGKAV